MAKYQQELVGVLPPELAESPSSWITRNALRQAVSPQELCKYFGLSGKTDLDFAFAGPDGFRIAGLCGLKSKKFRLMRLMFGRLRVLDRSGETYLLSLDGQPRYRFCPECLRERGRQYFPLHWRFNAWRWCPPHNCLLEDACRECGSPVVLPGDMLNGGAARQGVSSLARCLLCSASLASSAKRKACLIEPRLLTSWEMTQLSNGRAVLAALFHGYACMAKLPTRLSLRGLKRFEKLGLLPHDQFQLNSSELARRRDMGNWSPPAVAPMFQSSSDDQERPVPL